MISGLVIPSIYHTLISLIHFTEAERDDEIGERADDDFVRPRRMLKDERVKASAERSLFMQGDLSSKTEQSIWSR